MKFSKIFGGIFHNILLIFQCLFSDKHKCSFTCPGNKNLSISDNTVPSPASFLFHGLYRFLNNSSFKIKFFFFRILLQFFHFSSRFHNLFFQFPLFFFQHLHSFRCYDDPCSSTDACFAALLRLLDTSVYDVSLFRLS